MYRIYDADKDTYITNKVIGGDRKVSSSVGYASTIDIFKLYGLTSQISGSEKIPNLELSRGLIHFDLSDVKTLFNEKKIDIDHGSFKCYVNLKDVYGGQTTPSDFKLVLSPLSKSFTEGFGKDIVYLTDYDAANFLSSSFDNEWYLTGANLGISINDSSGGDYITTGTIGTETINFEVTQDFKTGFEDALFDVTHVVSATIIGAVPDEGYRLSFSSSYEDDKQSYFVKRFASRHAYDANFRPKLIVKFDDSIIDSSPLMYFSTSGSLFAYNYDDGRLSNLTKNGVELSGSNCVLLRLTTPISGGVYNAYFTGSQFSRGNFEISGTYYADVNVQTTQQLNNILNFSGSVEFTPIWTSLDESVTFVTGSKVKFYKQRTVTTPEPKKKFSVSAYGVPNELSRDDQVIVRVHIFDQLNPQFQLSKFAVNDIGKIIKNCHYRIRNINNSTVVVPFDTVHNSTRMSLDGGGLYFYLSGKSLTANNTYIIDILTIENGDSTTYNDCSIAFKVIS